MTKTPRAARFSAPREPAPSRKITPREGKEAAVTPADPHSSSAVTGEGIGASGEKSRVSTLYDAGGPAEPSTSRTPPPVKVKSFAEIMEEKRRRSMSVRAYLSILLLF